MNIGLGLNALINREAEVSSDVVEKITQISGVLTERQMETYSFMDEIET